VTIDKGEKVKWRNVEGTHTVTARRGSFDKRISGDETVSRRFRRLGTWRYFCRFHKAQGMKGKVIVE
jgi:plastocyanin